MENTKKLIFLMYFMTLISFLFLCYHYKFNVKAVFEPDRSIYIAGKVTLGILFISGLFYKILGVRLYGEKDKYGKNVNWDTIINTYCYKNIKKVECLLLVLLSLLISSVGIIFGVIIFVVVVKIIIIIM